MLTITDEQAEQIASEVYARTVVDSTEAAFQHDWELVRSGLAHAHAISHQTLTRAADMLTAYGELIRRDGASHVDEHHYLPEVEFVAQELRDMAALPNTQTTGPQGPVSR